MKSKTIALGNFVAKQHIVFEHKRLFSIVVFRFKGDDWQDRFHDHAFHAVSLCVWGSYRERILDPQTGVVAERPRGLGFRFFPRGHAHMLGHSKGCWTILFAGPWTSYWREWKDGKERRLGWGRVTRTQEDSATQPEQ